MASEAIENMSSSSCGHAHHAHGDHEHFDDPTLASCCERDERDYARAMTLKRLLTAHDPTSSGVRMRQALFQPPTDQIRPSTQLTRTSDAPTLHFQTDSDDSDDDLDDGLDALFAVRRQALEAQVRLAAECITNGIGVVIESDVAQLLRELRATPNVPRVVLVSSTVNSTRAADTLGRLHAAMAGVARKFVGTQFVRVAVRSSDDAAVAARELRLRSPLCAVAFRNGEQVDAMPLDSTARLADMGTFWEAQLIPWLTMCGVLLTTTTTRHTTTTPTTAIRANAATTDDDSDDREPAAYDCGVENCRIRFSFEHEHVGPSQAAKSEVSAWRS